MGTFKMIQHEGTTIDSPYYYIGAITNNIKHPSKIGLIDFGYTFEKLILYATFLGFGTCWIGGSYHSAEAEKLLKSDI